MNPALSVIFFTTLSGTGLGLWIWLGLRMAFGPQPEMFEPIGWIVGVLVGAVLVATGVIASLWHLGKPMRVWRAFSQWRSSWMSREGVFAVACFVPVAWILFGPHVGYGNSLRFSAGLLACLALCTVHSTAMIYASLKPVPAWRHRSVPLLYLLFALLTGGVLCQLFLTVRSSRNEVYLLIAVIALVTAALKWRYWRDIDADGLPLSRGDAVGMPKREVSVFERPHTEANYLTREMGFVMAREHARWLRPLAMLLFTVPPVLLGLGLWLQWFEPGIPLIAIIATLTLAGVFVERWLFFAQARHMVTLYY